MLAKLRSRLEEKEEGFTLVELLVVIIIIGILAAIAIPLYLNQQEKAHDAALKSDLKNAQIEAASQLVDDTDGSSITMASITAEMALSPNVSLVSVVATPTDFKICGKVTTGSAVGKAGMCINVTGQLTDSAGAAL